MNKLEKKSFLIRDVKDFFKDKGEIEDGELYALGITIITVISSLQNYSYQYFKSIVDETLEKNKKTYEKLLEM